MAAEESGDGEMIGAENPVGRRVAGGGVGDGSSYFRFTSVDRAASWGSSAIDGVLQSSANREIERDG